MANEQLLTTSTKQELDNNYVYAGTHRIAVSQMGAIS